MSTPPIVPKGPDSANYPSYVRACARGEWSLHLRAVRGPAEGIIVPYSCGSRAHHGACRHHWRSVFFARLRAGVLGEANHGHVCFFTLTLPSNWHTGHEVTREKANKELGRMWRAFARPVNAKLRRAGMPPMSYVWVREDHRSGTPHVHAIIVSSAIADDIRRRDKEVARKLGGEQRIASVERALATTRTLSDASIWSGEDVDYVLSVRDKNCATGWVGEQLQRAGFGRSDVQVARDHECVSSYITKVTSQTTDTHLAGELTKEAQIGDILPSHCRSYGASRGFLAPRVREGRWTGILRGAEGEELKKQATMAKVVEQQGRPRSDAGPVFSYSAGDEALRFDTVPEAFEFCKNLVGGHCARKYRLKGGDGARLVTMEEMENRPRREAFRLLERLSTWPKGELAAYVEYWLADR